jgi:hypothetical protein
MTTTKRSFRYVLLGALSLVLAACKDGAVTVPQEVRPANTSLSTAAEEAALTEITRLVALAMSDAGLRHRVKADMRASYQTAEHKLALNEYLRGESGGILLAKMVKQSGRSRSEVIGLLSAVRPLEFYMPVPAHRESWTGGADLVVGSQFRDHTSGVAFTLEGTRIDLGVDEVPAQPTMALIPVETDFSRPLNPNRFKNRNDRGGTSIGTLYLEECDNPEAVTECPSDGGGGGGGDTGGSAVRGVYYIASSMRGVGEGAFRGAPEIEVHAHRSYNPNRSTSAENPPFPSCQAGETLSGARRFNQDREVWSGNALVLDSATASAYMYPEGSESTAGRTFTITFWEDDTEPCRLITNISLFDEFAMAAVGGAFITIGLSPTRNDGMNIPGTWWARLLFIAIGTVAINDGSGFFSTNDEYLGVAEFRESVENPGYPDHSHILIRERGERNGAVTLTVK